MDSRYKNIKVIFILVLIGMMPISFAQTYIIGWRPSGTSMEACSHWGLTNLEACQTYGYDNINYYRKCSHGSSSGGMGLSQCILDFVAALPDSESPQPQFCSGNPIDNITGAKIQQEIDIPAAGVGQVSFTRTYNNANKKVGAWFNTYDKHILIFQDQSIGGIRAQGLPRPSKSQACSSGWSSIRTGLADNWAQGATVRWVEGREICQVVKNNQVVKQLAIFPSLPIMRSVFPSYAQLNRDNGVIFKFYKVSNDVFTHGDDNAGVLKILNKSPLQWQLNLPSGDVEIYNNKGQLTMLIANNGMKQELFYDEANGLLTRVSDTTGRELLLSYNGNQLISVTVDGNKITSYSYNSEGLITNVIRPDNTERVYHYEDSRFPTALTGITDEIGNRYATWTYDDQGRAISSEHAGGAEKTMLTFNNNMSTTVTNALNKNTQYFYTYVAGTLRVHKVEGQPTENCAGANQNYTYTPEGWLESKTDWKGIKTTYQYNSLGQEVSRTEAFGTSDARTITTEWHPALFVKTKITEPDKETIYNYDENGRLLNQSARSITVQ